jgi:hypothetical protein
LKICHLATLIVTTINRVNWYTIQPKIFWLIAMAQWSSQPP